MATFGLCTGLVSNSSQWG